MSSSHFSAYLDSHDALVITVIVNCHLLRVRVKGIPCVVFMRFLKCIFRHFYLKCYEKPRSHWIYDSFISLFFFCEEVLSVLVLLKTNIYQQKICKPLDCPCISHYCSSSILAILYFLLVALVFRFPSFFIP